MVSVNVAQLLKAAPGAVRQLDFSERIPDPNHELHLLGRVTGHARLTLTSRGVLVHAEHVAPVALECARCLRQVRAVVAGSFDEEFVPTTDVRTGLPVPAEPESDATERSEIDAHHEIHLDELLRQAILTSLPLRALCESACPGLCVTCGARLDARHPPHPEAAEGPGPAGQPSPFARLAELLGDEP